MSELIVWTYDWVPEGPRGFVRDLRLRWAWKPDLPTPCGPFRSTTGGPTILRINRSAKFRS